MEKPANDPFDFSKTKIGDRLTRIYQSNAWDADVVEVTDSHIKCGMSIDSYRIMTFDRKTGISEHGKSFGFIVNMPLEQWEQNLIFSCCDEGFAACIDSYDLVKNLLDPRK